MRLHSAFTVRQTSIFALITLLGVLTFPARAANLPPGGVVALSGTTLAQSPSLNGVVIADVITPFTITIAPNIVLVGRLQDKVVRENHTERLDFYSQITLTPSDPNFPTYFFQNVTVSRTDFTNVTINADFRLDQGGNTAPQRARRSASGAIVAFDWLNNWFSTPGTSRSLFLQTNAFQYAQTGLTSISIGGSSVTLKSFRPIP